MKDLRTRFKDNPIRRISGQDYASQRPAPLRISFCVSAEDTSNNADVNEVDARPLLTNRTDLSRVNRSDSKHTERKSPGGSSENGGLKKKGRPGQKRRKNTRDGGDRIDNTPLSVRLRHRPIITLHYTCTV